MPLLKMPLRWQIAALVATPIAAVVILLIALNSVSAPSNSDGGVENASTVPGAESFTQDVPLIDVLRAADALAKAGKLPEQQPSLLEVLQSADVLAKAGKLPAQPSLLEVLQSADALAKAGLLPAQEPSLLEVLQSADALAKAGKLPAQPSLLEVLQSADALAKAGLLSAQEPSLLEVLQSADALARAGKLPGQEHAVSAPPQAPADAPQPAAGESGWFDGSYSARVRALVNERRAERGLLPLADEPRLVDAADGYARVLTERNWFDHVGPDGSTLVDRVEAAGFPFTVQVGEVLAWGTQAWPAEGVVDAWLNSPAHRDEILSDAYTRAGIGCYFTDGNGTTVRCVMDLAG